MDLPQWTFWLQVGLPLLLLVAGFIFGRIAERRHYRAIHRREDQCLHIPISTERRLYPQDRMVIGARLASGSVVVSVDHFKRFLAWLRGLFGGEIHSYGSLLDRARREAKLRMLESCQDADLFLNFRFETSTISGAAGNSWGTVEILAYATALYFEDDLQSDATPLS